MVDAFSVLRRDHEKVERALGALEDGPNAASGADQAELIAKGRLTQQLIADESGHEQELGDSLVKAKESVPTRPPAAG